MIVKKMTATMARITWQRRKVSHAIASQENRYLFIFWKIFMTP